MATGSSANKGFDFAGDDILCSYEDYNQDVPNGVHSDQSLVPISAKEVQKIRMARSMFSPASNPPEGSYSQDVAAAVEITMKKQTDNVMRFLEGLSSRLSQLELYCYNIDKSVGQMRSELERDHIEADLKLRSLDKNLQEVHRSVQILKDKQDLAETQRELAKLQLAQDTSSAQNSQLNEERSASSTPSPPKQAESAPDMQGMQLALALPNQFKPVEQHQIVSSQPQNLAPSQAYYMPTQFHYVQSDSYYRVPQTQDMSKAVPVTAQTQANQAPQFSSPHYQQQWVQQMPQQQQQQMTPTHPSMQTQVRPQLTPVYSQYPPSQTVNPTPESLPNSRPMQMPYPGVSQPGSGYVEATSYVYVGPNRTMQQQPPSQQPPSQQPPPQQPPPQQLPPQQPPPQQLLPQQPPPQQLPTQQPQYAYMVYESESGRARIPLQSQQTHFPQGGYPQANASTNILVRPPQSFRGHPHGEVIEKLVNMGYRADHVASVIQRSEESGQPVNFNAVLDRLNGHSSGGSQGGWSG